MYHPWEKTQPFSSFAGVSQGENLSPVHFSIYLNDLKKFILQSRNNGIDLTLINDEMTFFGDLVLLYSDDAVILADTEENLQYSLVNDLFHNYNGSFKLIWVKLKLLLSELEKQTLINLHSVIVTLKS